MTLWLASASPRRRQLLEWAGFELEVRPAHLDESRPAGLDPVAHAKRLATLKARSAPEQRLALGADTVVHYADRIFDKPESRQQARAHLLALSGAWHDVTTGVCVRRPGKESVFAVTTAVRFRSLSAPEIDRYVQSGEADDKAGAYGIQGLGGALVAEVRGSWTNVMGLPLEETLQALV